MKKNISYLMICICCLGLCGCTSYPELSDSDMDLVAEYAAGLLLQHSEKADNRLVDLEDALLEMENEKTEEEIPEEPVEDAQEENQEEVLGDEVAVTDNTEQAEENVPSQPMNQVLGLTEISLLSNGYEIKDSYPDGEGSFFALDASEGCKLIVMKYTLSNHSDSSVDINMLENDTTYKVSLDGVGYKFALSTMLLDDLSTYAGTVESGASVELVLISEWKEEEINNITNPTLYIKGSELTGVYKVQ